MEQTESPSSSIFATEPIGRLIAKFAIPCVISLLVNSLYNIVDQIFIGWGVGYLGNGATNIVFPITIVALSLSLMIGDGGAAYLSLKLGEGDIESAKKGVGNAIVLVTVVSILLAAVFLIGIGINPILDLFGATDVLRPYALQYGTIIGLGLPFMMIPGAINSMIRADGSPKYAMFSMALGIPCYDQELIQKIAARAAFTRAMCRLPARTPPAVFWPRPSPATSRATAMPTTSGRSSIRLSPIWPGKAPA